MDSPDAPAASPKSAEPFSTEAHARAVEEAFHRVRPQLPDMDPQTLMTILSSVLRPFGTGKRFLLRTRENGRRVF